MIRVATIMALAASPIFGAEREPVTFAKHIAPVVHSKCTICHRQGQPGPFELITYEDVKKPSPNDPGRGARQLHATMEAG